MAGWSAMEVDRTKRRVAEFAEKNAEKKKEGVIEKNSAFLSANFATLRFVDYIHRHRRLGNVRCVARVVVIPAPKPAMPHRSVL